MRRRIRTLGTRPMARRPGSQRRIQLSPQALRMGGWVAAIVIVLLIAAAVRLFGGGGAGPALGPSPSPSGPVLLPITFGTALDERRLVPDAARAASFSGEQTFAYSVADASPVSTVYVEVRRTAGGPVETVQAPVDVQKLPNPPSLIGFTVPASALIDAFGTGTFEMLIYLDPAGQPIASGTFELAGAGASSAAQASP